MIKVRATITRMGIGSSRLGSLCPFGNNPRHGSFMYRQCTAIWKVLLMLSGRTWYDGGKVRAMTMLSVWEVSALPFG